MQVKDRKEKPVLNEDEDRSYEYLKEQVDYTIASCVTSKTNNLDKAYDIRNGKMPMENYEYLKSAEGIELPSKVRHIPVLKSMFDTLQGDESLQPVPYQITCRDSESIEEMARERHQAFVKVVEGMISRNIEQLVKEVNNSDNTKMPITGSYVSETDFFKAQENHKSYKTFLEIYSQKVMDSELEINNMKFRFNVMFNDLITAGQEYYQSKVIGQGISPLFREINPKHLYYEKSHNTHFIKDCSRVVYVEEIPAPEVYMRWGHKFTKEEREEFFEIYSRGVTADNIQLVSSIHGNVEGSQSSFAVKNLNSDLCKVYWVEWKENTKVESEYNDEIVINKKKVKVSDKLVKYKLDRYEGVRINEKIYVDMGKSKYVIRTSRNPSDAPLTFNGACYNDRNGEPFSMVLATEELAQKIDVMHYFLENLVAVSGTKVIPVHVPDIPEWLHADPVIRVQKFLGYVKQGVALLDYSQDGAGKFQQNTMWDMSISNAVGTIKDIIIFLEETASKITGVSRQRMAQMVSKDGKGVTENAIEQSTIVTQPMLQLHNTVIRMALTDQLNHCRMAYPTGYPGLFALGKFGREVFTIGHKKFSLADFDIHVSDSSEELRAIEEIKVISRDLATAMQINPKFLFDMIGNKSLTHIKELAKNAFESGEEDKVKDLSNQLNEANNQLQQFKAELDRAQQEDREFKVEELKVKSQESQAKLKIEDSKARSIEKYNVEKLKLDEKRVQLEHLQLAYNPKAAEIRNE